MVANTLNLQKGTVLHFLTFDSLKKFQDEMIFFLPQNDWPVKDLSENIYFSHIQFHYPLYFIKFHFYDFDPVKSISSFNGLYKFHQRTPAIRPPLTGKCFLCAEGLKKHPYLVLKGWNF